MSGMRQKIQYSLALEPAHQGESPVGGCQRDRTSRGEASTPKPGSGLDSMSASKHNPRRTAGYVTRMPGGVGGAAPRAVHLTRPLPRSAPPPAPPGSAQEGAK